MNLILLKNVSVVGLHWGAYASKKLIVYINTAVSYLGS